MEPLPILAFWFPDDYGLVDACHWACEKAVKEGVIVNFFFQRKKYHVFPGDQIEKILQIPEGPPQEEAVPT